MKLIKLFLPILLLWLVVPCTRAQVTLKTLHTFTGPDGRFPRGPLIQGNDGKFYGATEDGGLYGCCYGTVFNITPSGTLTTLYSFNGADGYRPGGDTGPDGVVLLQGTDGNFYGTTEFGGIGFDASNDRYGYGTLFRMTPGGALEVLFFFGDSNGPPLLLPTRPRSGLVQAPDGSLYGTTDSGGTNDDGTMFKMTRDGALTTLVSLSYTSGYQPDALLQGSDGNLYGTTRNGGGAAVSEATLTGQVARYSE